VQTSSNHRCTSRLLSSIMGLTSQNRKELFHRAWPECLDVVT
jgi:hypothetical protein